jgi:hypothetical protein
MDQPNTINIETTKIKVLLGLSPHKLFTHEEIHNIIDNHYIFKYLNIFVLFLLFFGLNDAVTDPVSARATIKLSSYKLWPKVHFMLPSVDVINIPHSSSTSTKL